MPADLIHECGHAKLSFKHNVLHARHLYIILWTAGHLRAFAAGLERNAEIGRLMNRRSDAAPIMRAYTRPSSQCVCSLMYSHPM